MTNRTILTEAICFAARAHEGQTRKGTNIPYIVHPMEAAAIVGGMTDDQEVIAAAVLHDAVEDCEGVSLDTIAETFGARVAALVAEESERKEADAAGSWQRRKQATVDHLQGASEDVLMLTLGDKLSNIRSLYRDHRTLGDQLWTRFNQSDPAKIAWYYRSILNALKPLEAHPAYGEYRRYVELLFNPWTTHV